MKRSFALIGWSGFFFHPPLFRVLESKKRIIVSERAFSPFFKKYPSFHLSVRDSFLSFSTCVLVLALLSWVQKHFHSRYSDGFVFQNSRHQQYTTCNMTFNIVLHVSLLCGAFKIPSSEGNLLREKRLSWLSCFALACKPTSLLSCNSVVSSTTAQINGCIFCFSERSNHSMGREEELVRILWSANSP